MGFYERQSQADWEEAYDEGYEAGYEAARRKFTNRKWEVTESLSYKPKKSKRKQKPSAWNKFVKANSKKKKFIYQSGANKGKLNLKKMGVAWRKTPAGKKKR